VADNAADGYAVGTSADEGQSWHPLMRYDQIAAIQSCVMAACQDDCLVRAAGGQWADDFCAATAPAPHDAGSEPPDAGPESDAAQHDAGASDAPASKSGCSCAVDDSSASVALPWITAFLATALRRRRRANPSP